MKRIISVLLTITMLLGVTTSVALSASAATTDKVESGLTYTDEYGEWTYKLNYNGDGCIITGYDKSMTEIEIPSTINGLPVLGQYRIMIKNNKTKEKTQRMPLRFTYIHV